MTFRKNPPRAASPWVRHYTLFRRVPQSAITGVISKGPRLAIPIRLRILPTMDSVTHLVAGALTPMACKSAPQTKTMILFGILCAQLPDIDIIAGKSPEALMSLHRGITHALVAQPVFALVMALLFHALIKKSDPGSGWTFAKTWLLALFCLLTHLFLDSMTTFGTQIFLPFSDMRVALPAMYIIDLLLTLPLLAALLILLRRGVRRMPPLSRVRLARGALLWLFCYPLAALALNHALAANLEERYARKGNDLGITGVELSPEPFSPLNWKVVGIAPDAYYMGRYLLTRPGEDLAFTKYNRVDPGLWNKLRADVPVFSLFSDFATYPYQTERPTGDGKRLITFADLRYEATMPGLMEAVGRGDGIFLMQAKTGTNGAPVAWRFLFRGRDAATQPWTVLPDAAAGTSPAGASDNAG